MPQFFRLQPIDQPLQRIYCGGCPARNKVMGDLAFGLRGLLHVLLCSVRLRFLCFLLRDASVVLCLRGVFGVRVHLACCLCLAPSDLSPNYSNFDAYLAMPHVSHVSGV